MESAHPQVRGEYDEFLALSPSARIGIRFEDPAIREFFSGSVF